MAKGALGDIVTGKEAAPAPGSRLRAVEGGAVTKLRPVTTVGREPDADLTIDDAFTSSQHARIVWEGGTWAVHDLGSTNGTQVNGEGVSISEMAHGDTITFGRTSFVFEER